MRCAALCLLLAATPGVVLATAPMAEGDFAMGWILFEVHEADSVEVTLQGEGGKGPAMIVVEALRGDGIGLASSGMRRTENGANVIVDVSQFGTQAEELQFEDGPVMPLEVQFIWADWSGLLLIWSAGDLEKTSYSITVGGEGASIERVANGTRSVYASDHDLQGDSRLVVKKGGTGLDLQESAWMVVQPQGSFIGVAGLHSGEGGVDILIHQDEQAMACPCPFRDLSGPVAADTPFLVEKRSTAVGRDIPDFIIAGVEVDWP